jgi:hypothetical protein
MNRDAASRPGEEAPGPLRHPRMVSTDDGYAKRAEEAEALAAAAKSDFERDAFLQVAHGWRDLIAERARQRKGPR